MKNNNFYDYINKEPLVKKAHDLAKKYLSVIKRMQKGKTMFNHAFDVANYLFLSGIKKPEIIAAGFLHDVLEDSGKSVRLEPSLEKKITKKYLDKEFNLEIGDLVQYLSNVAQEEEDDIDYSLFEMKDLDYQKYILKRTGYVKSFIKHLFEAKKENLIDELLLIKFFDRFNNMETLDFHKNAYKKNVISKETMDIYFPLFQHVKLIPESYLNEMADMALKYAYPKIAENRRQSLKKLLKKINQEKEYLINSLNNKNYNTSVSIKNISSYEIYSAKNTNQKIQNLYEIIIEDKQIHNNSFNQKKSLQNILLSVLYQSDIERYKLISNNIEYNLENDKSNIKINLYSNISHISFKLVMKPEKILQDKSKLKNVTEFLAKSEINEDIVKETSNEIYKEMKDQLLSGVEVYTKNGQKYNFPQKSTLRDLAFKIHTDLGVWGEYANINYLENIPLNEKIENFSNSIINIVIKKDKNNPNFEKINSEITLPLSKKKLNQFIKRYFASDLIGISEKSKKSLFNKIKKIISNDSL